MMPLVSVILPTYNWRSEWLSESINSVLNQTFKDFELIIINDASTNNIEKTIKEYEKKDSRILYLRNEKNLKLTNTLNRGLGHAKWKFIARIDDDDVRVNKDKLEKQVNFMKNNPKCWLCWAGTLINIDEKWNIINKMSMRTTEKEIRNTMLQACQFLHSSVLIRKSTLDKVWFYNEQFYPADDYELWCRIWVNNSIFNIKDITLLYRINTNWITKKNSLKMNKMWFKVCIKYRNYYPNFFKALILRIWAFIIPNRLTEKIVKILRKK